MGHLAPTQLDTFIVQDKDSLLGLSIYSSLG